MKATTLSDSRAAAPKLASTMAVMVFAYLVTDLLVWFFLQTAARTPALGSLRALGPVLAAGFAWFASRRAPSRRLRFFWSLLAAAMGVGAAAGILHAATPSPSAIEAALPLTADVLSIVSYCLEFAAVVSLVALGRSRLAAVGVVLEALIFAIAAGLLAWQYLLLPSLYVESLTFSGLMAVLYPAGDILLLAAVLAVVLLPSSGRLPRGLPWFAGVFAVGAIADAAYAVLAVDGSYQAGSWMDPLWPLASGLLGIAALWQFTRPPLRPADPRDRNGRHETSLRANPRDQVRMVVPYLAMPVTGWVIYLSLTSTDQPAVLYQTVPLTAAFVLVGLILFRQYFTVLENRRLQASLALASRDLQERVVQRTAELSLLNRMAFAMSRCSTSRQVVQQGLELAKEVLDCEAAGLRLRLPGSRERFFGSAGLNRVARLSLRMAAETALLRAGSQSQERPLVSDWQNAWATESLRQTAPNRAVGLAFDQVVVAELVSRHTSLGDLCLALKGKALEESSPQLELVMAVAAQMAVALENARRFEEAHFLAQRDPITGLFNHRGMDARLEEEYSRCHRSDGSFSVVMMDLDNFKLFNDSYGHAAGDDILQQVARVLTLAARRSDVVARYGGDEFMVLLPDTEVTGVMSLVKRVQDDLETDASFVDKATGNRVPIALSFGVATYPNEGLRLSEILGAADVNLYRSKQRGGNTVTAPLTELGPTHKLGMFHVLDGLVTTVDNKDHYTRKHSDDVCELSVALAERLGLSYETQRSLRMAGLLHDVGKIGVPDGVLRKPAALDDEEREAVKQHVTLGRLIIKEIPNLSEVLDAVASHHERWDGDGYPEGLRGDDIPLLGRILAVADAYSAMTSDRPYRKALSTKDAVAELRRVAGTQLDPALVHEFTQAIEYQEQTSTTRRARKAG